MTDSNMSGHSKWSKVKHQKESTDAVKGKVFTKMANSIIIAVKEGGGVTDPESNFKLRLAIEKSKSVNMPKENIQRAIERAGKTEVNAISEIIYEAFGLKGIGILIKCATGNKQRTVSELKNILDKNGGVLAASGSVSHLFTPVGLIEITRNNQNSDKILEIAMEAGADDILEEQDNIFIYTKPNNLHQVRENLETFGLTIRLAEQYFRPLATIPINDKSELFKIEKIISILEERDDVLKVFSNHQALNV